MLILSRKVGEAVVLDEKITVRVIDISKGVVRIGFDAPNDMLILREELEEEVKQANIGATSKVEDVTALKDFSKKLKKK
ncbi:carbon storage regulator CsrA [Sulfurospirillum arcachonense]|uniref:carbon storage regulator CsrA n=1 Tax=Sulfurospirillum arcachonense TaxID=57666 RepID=UPI000468F87D|nr:carbon storage regulator CsrA [Sulfurospirillum arcachonense]